MPFLSGDSLVGLFRRHPTLKDVPVVLFSSNEESLLRAMAASTGALGYISKSEMAHDFAHQVTRFLIQQRHSSRPPVL
jgi:CheY-like chemotaxis protein